MSPEDISLWDIYNAVEGYNRNELFKFHPEVSSECQIGGFFGEVLGVHLDEAVQAMGAKMAKVSLAQLIDEWQDVLRQ